MVRLCSTVTTMRPSITCRGPRAGTRRLAVVRLCCGTRRCRPAMPALACGRINLGSPSPGTAQHPGRGGSLHEPGKCQLDSSANLHPHQRFSLFQRSPVDELSRPLLPPPLAVRRGSDMVSRASQCTSAGLLCNDRRCCCRSSGAPLLFHVALNVDLLAAFVGDVYLQGGRVPGQSPDPGKCLNRSEEPRLS